MNHGREKSQVGLLLVIAHVLAISKISIWWLLCPFVSVPNPLKGVLIQQSLTEQFIWSTKFSIHVSKTIQLGSDNVNFDFHIHINLCFASTTHII